ncbi:helix-turn-helix transcriptional regulator [Allokutzneria multivorans]|uniref:helix-turn-helix domain-containing protein n=1 Tax=Allokutzneria multivorans TaxID=1142134 RepID=UPI0031E595F8
MPEHPVGLSLRRLRLRHGVAPETVLQRSTLSPAELSEIEEGRQWPPRALVEAYFRIDRHHLVVDELDRRWREDPRRRPQELVASPHARLAVQVPRRPAPVKPWPDPSGFTAVREFGAGLRQLREASGYSLALVAERASAMWGPAAAASRSTFGNVCTMPTLPRWEYARQLVVVCGAGDGYLAEWSRAWQRLAHAPEPVAPATVDPAGAEDEPEEVGDPPPARAAPVSLLERVVRIRVVTIILSVVVLIAVILLVGILIGVMAAAPPVWLRPPS